MRVTHLKFSYSNPLIERFGAEFFRSIPQAAGVYFMHAENGEILYIGKAKNLKARLAWYKNARPGSAPEHTIECLESVARLRWEEWPTEHAALLRESELLHAVRPPFNSASTWPQAYLYIGVRVEEVQDSPSRGVVHFQLTSRREIARGYRIYGCYKHRSRTKMGYTALLRLLYAASYRGQRRFSFPARITRSSPPYRYSLDASGVLVRELDGFFAGRSQRLLRRTITLLLENDAIPTFMRPGLQDDIGAVQEFFVHGPKATRDLKRANGIRTRVVSHRRMEQCLRRSVEEKSLEAERPKIPMPRSASRF